MWRALELFKGRRFKIRTFKPKKQKAPSDQDRAFSS